MSTNRQILTAPRESSIPPLQHMHVETQLHQIHMLPATTKRPTNHQHTHVRCINCVIPPVETTLWELIVFAKRIAERAQSFEVFKKQSRSSMFVVCCGSASLRKSTPINTTQHDLKSRGQIVAGCRGALVNCLNTQQIVAVFGDALVNAAP